MGKRSSIKAYYDREAHRWLPTGHSIAQRYYHGSMHDSLFRGVRGGRALDLGCGAGASTFPLAENGYEEVHALDISPVMLAHLDSEASRRGISTIRTRRGDASALPYPDGTFDLVISVGLMECTRSPGPIMHEIRRVLKPGGTTGIRFLNRKGIWGMSERVRNRLGLPSGIQDASLYSREEVLDIAATAGFTDVEVTGCTLLPLFLFPRPLSTFTEHLFITTGIAARVEAYGRRRQGVSRPLHYALCARLTKPR